MTSPFCDPYSLESLNSLLIALRLEQSRVSVDKRHVYRVDGKHMPNVTTVIKVMDAPQLDAWKVRVQVEGTAKAAHANPPVFGEDEDAYTQRLVALAAEQYEHERLSEQAADTGKQVHALIEAAVREMLGEPAAPLEPEPTDEARFIFAGWREWAAAVGFRPLLAEARVIHRAENYCGTLDLLALVEDRPAVVDWKTSKAIYPEMRLQSAAYRMALRSVGWPELDGYVVRLPKDGGDIHMEALGDPTDDWEAFRACLQLYRWRKAA